MGIANVSIPSGLEGATINFTVSGALGAAIAQAFAADIANANGAGMLAALQQLQPNSVDVGAVMAAGGLQTFRIAVPVGAPLMVGVAIPAGSTPAQAAAAILAQINVDYASNGYKGRAMFAPGSTTKIILPVGSLALGGAGVPGPMGPVTLTADPNQAPPVPAGQVGFAIIDDATEGDVVTIPTGYNYVYNESPADIVLDATAASPIVISTGTGSTTLYGGAGGGADVADNGNNLFQALGSGGGQYFIAFASGSNTVWANSGNDVISAGPGANLIGLGSGNNFVFSGGADTILAGSGNDTIIGAPSDADLVFGSSGSLVFDTPSAATIVAGSGAATVVGGTGDLVFGSGSGLLFAGGSASTVVGSAGSETLFGAPGSSGLFFVGTGAFLLAAEGASDTVVGGAGASSVTLFAENGGSVALFSSAAGNVLVAGAGNATLNAAGSSGGNTFWAGSGADSLVGGSGADVFAFESGTVGGSDTISGWNANDTLVLLGYGTAVPGQATVNGNDVFTLNDGTTITVVGVGAPLAEAPESSPTAFGATGGGEAASLASPAVFGDPLR